MQLHWVLLSSKTAKVERTKETHTAPVPRQEPSRRNTLSIDSCRGKDLNPQSFNRVDRRFDPNPEDRGSCLVHRRIRGRTTHTRSPAKEYNQRRAGSPAEPLLPCVTQTR
ncbi:Hypothetical protein SMAX5B_014123 [Scophthalmus maximus]|uniref:Uncharacterized protein n=1 Tax=Scophthalmus maximus TaxID=52904 RepID=A0A2U9BHZ2_SCOMX|nr:Hypothetical protein SMAX5B_014123 [Scophthalmus maximus]